MSAATTRQQLFQGSSTAMGTRASSNADRIQARNEQQIAQVTVAAAADEAALDALEGKVDHINAKQKELSSRIRRIEKDNNYLTIALICLCIAIVVISAIVINRYC